ncbi:hypothetical protein GCM10010402_08290 [Actinomadura luteofluorescens]|uniref:hypothetical protein n=1 Tax=Actinomadura luteofluorescens TaxID=46163 RepID=UPI0021648797|nr:hypothetical protein [Actinomadura glauciflava]MCR3738384.1 hypothetical protein [Actinomadura glauciflava]
MFCPASPLRRLIAASEPAASCPPGMAVTGTGARCLEEARDALSLITIRSIQTGRTLPAAPLAELTADQLIEFWADESMLD